MSGRAAPPSLLPHLARLATVIDDERSGAEPARRLASVDEFHQLLGRLTVSSSQSTTKAAREWVLAQCKTPQAIEALLHLLYNASLAATQDIAFRASLHTLYLLSDLIGYARSKGVGFIVAAIAQNVASFLHHAFHVLGVESDKIVKLLNIWAERHYFSPEKIEEWKQLQHQNPLHLPLSAQSSQSLIPPLFGMLPMHSVASPPPFPFFAPHIPVQMQTPVLFLPAPPLPPSFDSNHTFIVPPPPIPQPPPPSFRPDTIAVNDKEYSWPRVPILDRNVSGKKAEDLPASFMIPLIKENKSLAPSVSTQDVRDVATTYFSVTFESTEAVSRILEEFHQEINTPQITSSITWEGWNLTRLKTWRSQRNDTSFNIRNEESIDVNQDVYHHRIHSHPLSQSHMPFQSRVHSHSHSRSYSPSRSRSRLHSYSQSQSRSRSRSRVRSWTRSRSRSRSQSRPRQRRRSRSPRQLERSPSRSRSRSRSRLSHWKTRHLRYSESSSRSPAKRRIRQISDSPERLGKGLGY